MTDDWHGKTYGRFTMPTRQADLLWADVHGLALARSTSRPPAASAAATAFAVHPTREAQRAPVIASALPPESFWAR
ncbi:hypothetical protein NPS01_06420 [Nocardioides psychrotolerans]|uniref:Uncharacterized protein n=1 Tax=Nocardioides psychrotolerans TaxID=1005945 RepID=A0A1I3D0F8_9ACTN|nr:hypothetical protein NPS01_06420 [Nocardioides psychrotolerans]SFH80106.1 hypothetical protein SAMN05216561_102296 [Nocardioides psychrotolerans]